MKAAILTVIHILAQIHFIAGQIPFFAQGHVNGYPNNNGYYNSNRTLNTQAAAQPQKFSGLYQNVGVVPNHVKLDMGNYHCQGTIIGPNLILTEKRCVSGLVNDLQAINIKGKDDAKLSVYSYTYHPSKVVTNDQDFNHPLALLEVTSSDFVGPTTQLQLEDLPNIENLQCEITKFGTKRGSFGGVYQNEVRQSKCLPAGSVKDHGDVYQYNDTQSFKTDCQNDRGMALICKISGTPKVVGIATDSACNLTFAKLSKHADFFNKK